MFFRNYQLYPSINYSKYSFPLRRTCFNNFFFETGSSMGTSLVRLSQKVQKVTLIEIKTHFFPELLATSFQSFSQWMFFAFEMPFGRSFLYLVSRTRNLARGVCHFLQFYESSKEDDSNFLENLPDIFYP